MEKSRQLSNKLYYSKNKEKLNENQKAYYREHKKNAKEYYQKNKERIRLYNYNYYRKKCGLKPVEKLPKK